MKDTKNNRAIYALYANNQFVSWLYGAFCQLTTSPKFYWCGENHEKQSEIVLTNLKDKLRRINNPINFGKLLGLDDSNPIDKGEDKESAFLSKFSNFSLGIFFVNEDEVTPEVLADLSKTVPDVVFEVSV